MPNFIRNILLFCLDNKKDCTCQAMFNTKFYLIKFINYKFLENIQFSNIKILILNF